MGSTFTFYFGRQTFYVFGFMVNKIKGNHLVTGFGVLFGFFFVVVLFFSESSRSCCSPLLLLRFNHLQILPWGAD